MTSGLKTRTNHVGLQALISLQFDLTANLRICARAREITSIQGGRAIVGGKHNRSCRPFKVIRSHIVPSIAQCTAPCIASIKSLYCANWLDDVACMFRTSVWVGMEPERARRRQDCDTYRRAYVVIENLPCRNGPFVTQLPLLPAPNPFQPLQNWLFQPPRKPSVSHGQYGIVIEQSTSRNKSST